MSPKQLGDEVYNRRMEGEPVFVLLGRDPNAPSVIRKWARDRAELVAVGQSTPDNARQILAAYELASIMEKWRAEHFGEWRAMPLFEVNQFEAGRLGTGGLSK